MYNGIGLRTARGSATNGHIQANLAAPRPPRIERNAPNDRDRALPDRAPDPKLLAHEERRQIEVRCMELRIQLENEDLPDAEIDTRVAALREELQAGSAARGYDPAAAKSLRSSDVHRLAAAKDREMQRFASALGMRNDYRPGEAFEDDYRDRQRLRRQEEKEARQRERQERQLAREQAHKQRQEEYEQRMARRAEQHLARDRPELARSHLDAELDAMAAERQRASRSRSRSRSRSPSESRSPPPVPVPARTHSYDPRSPSPRRDPRVRTRSRSGSYDSRDSRSPRRSASPRRRSYTPSQSRSPSPRHEERGRRY